MLLNIKSYSQVALDIKILSRISCTQNTLLQESQLSTKSSFFPGTPLPHPDAHECLVPWRQLEAAAVSWALGMPMPRILWHVAGYPGLGRGV